VAQAADVERLIRIVEIALVIGKNIVLIVSIFVGTNLFLAAYDFVTGNVGWGIVNLLLGLAGLVFLAQVRQARRRHRTRQSKRRHTPEKYHDVASA
jgi:CHASE3 domain sensor protein